MFQREFSLTIAAPGRTVTVQPPMRITFSCDKSIVGGLNRLTLKVYNLNEASRLAIVKDPDERKRIPIVLSAGYKGSSEIIFQGTIHKASNDRNGPDFISSIEALDGGEDYLAGFVSETVIDKKQAVDAVLGALPNTAKGKFTDLKEITRAKVLVGNPLKLLPSLLQDNETFYIDNEQLFIIKDNEVTASFVPEVSAKTGLLQTPQREQQRVTFETLMNPGLKIAGRCKLVSENAPYLNGVYRIDQITYSGDSEGGGGEWKQTATAVLASGFKVL